MTRTWTIIGVAHVQRSFKWYQSLFGLHETAPAHDYFGQVTDEDGAVLLCLHRWGDHDHPTLRAPDEGRTGNGLLLFFRLDDFEGALHRARSLGARAGGGAAAESGYGDTRVCTVGSGWVLRHGERTIVNIQSAAAVPRMACC